VADEAAANGSLVPANGDTGAGWTAAVWTGATGLAAVPFGATLTGELAETFCTALAAGFRNVFVVASGGFAG
jgi:hypothetical protein